MSSFLLKALLWLLGFYTIVVMGMAQDLSKGNTPAYTVLAAKEVVYSGNSVVAGKVGIAGAADNPTGNVKGRARQEQVSKGTLLAAYQAHAAKAGNTKVQQLRNGDLAALTLTPGVYQVSGDASLRGILVLDAKNQPNALFVVKVDKNLDIAPRATVTLKNGARASNVVWLVEQKAIIGEGAKVQGNIVAKDAVTLQKDAQLAGTVLSLNESVYLTQAQLSLLTDLSISMTISPGTGTPAKYAVGDLVTFTVQVRNLSTVDDEYVIASSALPVGLAYVNSIVTKPGTSYNPQTGDWIIERLQAGEQQTLTITARIIRAGYMVNTAIVGGVSVDSDLLNNKANQELCVVLAEPVEVTGPANVCVGTAATYSINPIIGATYTWAVPEGWSITSGRNSSQITISAGSAAGEISVSVNNICGASNPKRVRVEVVTSVPPQPEAIQGETNVCVGKEVTYTLVPVAGAVSYRWEVPAGVNVITRTETSITVSLPNTSPKTIALVATNGCGDSQPRNLTITPLADAPVAPVAITGPGTVCATAASVTYSVATQAQVDKYNWTVPGGWTILSGQGTTSITVRPTAQAGNVSVIAENSCGLSSARQTAVTVTQLPPPTPGAITGSLVACAGQVSITYSIAAVAGAKSYRWTVPTGWQITAGQNTTTVTVTAGSSGGRILVTAENECGANGNSALDVQATQAVPTTPVAIRGTSFGCANTRATYSTDPVAGASSYAWTVPAGWVIEGSATGTTITVLVGATAGDITVKAVNNCGEGSARSLPVKPETRVPNAPAAISGPAEVCQDRSGYVYSITPVAGVTRYNWTFPQGWVIEAGEGTATITVKAGSGNGNITVAAANDCGAGAAASLAVSVVPSPPATPGAITGLAAVCAGSTNVAYSIAPVPGASSYLWTTPGWTITSGQGTTSIRVSAGTTGTTISVVAINACGATSNVQLTAVLTELAPSRPGAIVGEVIPCVGKQYTYSTSAVTGATSFAWTIPLGWTKVSENNTSVTVIAGSNAGAVSVAAVNNCGTSSASTLALSPTSQGPVGLTIIEGSSNVCVGGSVKFSVPAVATASSYTWAVPAGWEITAGQDTREITVKLGTTTGQVRVTARNDCGATTVSKDVTVSTVRPVTPGVVTGAAAVCTGSAQTYSIAPVAGAVAYTWTFPEGWVVESGAATTSVRVIAGSTAGAVTVAATNGCGTGNSISKAVTITNGGPVLGAITGNTYVCGGAGNNIYMVASQAGVTSYTWTVSGDWRITAGQGTNSITVTAGTTAGAITVEGTNLCGKGAASTLLVTAQGQTMAPVAITGAAIACANSTDVVYTVTESEGNTCTWTVPAGWSITEGQGTNSIKVRTGAGGGTIAVTSTNKCNASVSANLAVTTTTIVPAAPGQIRGGGATCTGQTLTLSISPVSGATSYTWTLPEGWTFASGQGTTEVTIVAGATGGQVKVAARNSCGVSAEVTTQVAAAPMAVTELVIKDQSGPCAGLVYEAVPVAGATSYTWTVPTDWAIISGQGTNRIMVTAGTAPGDITVTAGNGVCSSNRASLHPNAALAGAAITIPNVFSPNNDGNNDTWVIENLENFKDNELTILNRWGNEVYKARSYMNTWDGSSLTEGTYFYLLKVKVCDGTDKMYKGYLTLVR